VHPSFKQEPEGWDEDEDACEQAPDADAEEDDSPPDDEVSCSFNCNVSLLLL
jgi:hypothetical protein